MERPSEILKRLIGGKDLKALETMQEAKKQATLSLEELCSRPLPKSS